MLFISSSMRTSGLSPFAENTFQTNTLSTPCLTTIDLWLQLSEGIMMLKIRILFSIINIIYAIFRRILLFIYKKPSRIPPITHPIYMLSATTLARKIRQREITSCEVVEAYISRIKEVNPFINAAIDERFSDALIEAKNCDEQLKKGEFDIETLEKCKPLYGVPITIKECLAVKGLSHTGCTLPRKGVKADHDAEVVKMVRNAGAIPLGVTNTPELCFAYDSTNLLYGRTCNPYDTRYSPGGSSGGEGALLGAGASVMGIGSDMAGSIRLPAFLNGVFGHKSTPGVVSTNGHFPYTDDAFLQMILTIGPMTKYAEDLSLLMKVMTSKCNRDLRLDVPVDLKQIKIYYREGLDRSFGILSTPPKIENCVQQAANHFVRYDIPVQKNQERPTAEMMKALFGLSQYTKQMLTFTVSFQPNFLFTKSEISYYSKQTDDLRQKLLDLLGDDGVLIYPTFRNQFLPQLLLCELLSFSSCALFNIFGCPATHVPMGLDHDGMPVGVQVIAAPYQDRLCLAVAKELEMAFGGWVPPSVSIGDKVSEGFCK
ncbi:fatty-acid amide hydrolase 2-like isoform X2 [Solenopsis invicta]|uniref:fatty-acid amide hydrolase 2-like isoform X2 n=1 Tax=Solenopsis invicta TaxID=13686 RepID=UPI00193D8FDD|nr:fatty-acid amide hydrolase 2-like isoform X2 [Solenopsis invicta]